MKIYLEQVEIVQALQQYISEQGINLAGKQVDVSFTAGRKDAGLTAEVDIQDAAKANLARIAIKRTSPATEDGPKELKAEPEEEVLAVEEGQEELDPVPAKTTSLFS